MKKILSIVLLLSSASLINAITYQESVQQAAAAKQKAAGAAVYVAPVRPVAPAVVTPVTAATVATVSTANVNPVYKESVEQLKSTIKPLISNIKILVPKVSDLVSKTAGGGVTGFLTGATSLAMSGETRTAIIDLIKQISLITSATKKLANADPSTKNTVKSLLGTVTKDPDFQKLLAIAKSVPIVGGELHKKLTELIEDAVKL